jgi:hypothetical protein
VRGGWADILALLKSVVETGTIPLRARITYAVQRRLLFLSPRSTLVDEVTRSSL